MRGYTYSVRACVLVYHCVCACTSVLDRNIISVELLNGPERNEVNRQLRRCRRDVGKLHLYGGMLNFVYFC